MQINGVFPWGRRLHEYQRMFRLNSAEQAGRILDCGGGPASFNAEMTALGRHVVSVDPLYQFSAEQIRERVNLTSRTILEGVEANRASFVWKDIPTPEALLQLRLGAMDLFLKDFSTGFEEGRYRAEALPKLSFSDGTFDLALVSHLLFLYTDEMSEELHVDSLLELLRVAREVRVFPLFDMKHQPSRHVQPVREALHAAGYASQLVRVDFEFQKGANQMLVVRRGAGSTELLAQE